MTYMKGQEEDREQGGIPTSPGEQRVLHESKPEPDDLTLQRRERMRRAASHLIFIGVSQQKATQLLGVYDIERIERQLAWLTSRRARFPSKLIVAAIEQDYPMPLSLQARQVTDEALGAGPDEP